ncbi:MAG: AbrB/MazE/SpoVT family DNA-binding domain-containing protein [Myxococcota bacterium]
MPTATVTSKGQITIPKEIRDALHVEEGQRVEFRLRPDGIVEMEPLNVDILRWFGAVRTDVRGVSVEEMDPGSASE